MDRGQLVSATRAWLFLDKFRESEIENLRLARSRDNQVFRFDIAVYNSLLVRGGESRSNLRGQLDRPSDLYFSSPKKLSQRLALDEFHGDEAYLAMLADFKDLRDVRVVNGGSGLRLLGKAPHPFPIFCEFSRQYLQRDLAVEPGVSSEIDFAHPAFTEQREDVVMANRLASFHRLILCQCLGRCLMSR